MAKATPTKGLNRSAFDNLLLYICQQVPPDELGKTKLCKCLWFSDLRAYAELGKSITGERYIKGQHGPIPADLPQVLIDLERKHRLATRKRRHFQGQYQYEQHEFVPLVEPDIKSQFSTEQMAIIGEVIHYVCHEHTAKEISELTHNRIWELAEIGEEIPLQTAFVIRMGEVTEEDMKWGRRVIAERSAASAAT